MDFIVKYNIFSTLSLVIVKLLSLQITEGFVVLLTFQQIHDILLKEEGDSMPLFEHYERNGDML